MADALSVRPRARRRMPSRSGDADRGAAAVEFALLLPVAVMLVFGVLTGGQLYSQKIGLAQAAREGARYGATLPIPPATGQSVNDWLTDVFNATMASSAGDYPASASGSSLCVSFLDGQDATKSVKVTADSAGNPTTPVTGTCWTDLSGLTDNRVQVLIVRTVELNIGIKDWNVPTSARASIHYERTANL
jgi:Flp pilus assembly protein TadG